MIRKPAVAGRFYPADSEVLKRDLQSFLQISSPTKKADGIVVPHAGYMYSGHVAGAVYASIEIPSRVIILCPNHTGLGEPLSIMVSGEWEIPLGRIATDSELARVLMRHCHLLAEDHKAHEFEHSLEVQLPFLFFLKPDLKFVPITVGTSRYATIERLGQSIAETRQELGEDILVVASSDMNHYESEEITRKKDRKAIDRILALDPKGLYDVIRKESISMCGYGPAISMLCAGHNFPHRSAELVKYATSGEISGNLKEVVGYAGIAVHS
ncbi:MAG: AmmeMemoRadiSam system protein B [Acidobacteriota bacterium]